MASEFSITGDQTVLLTADATDDVGNVIADGLAGATGFGWSESSGGTVVTLVPAEDGLSAQVTAVGPAGVSTVTVSATLADGVTVVSGSSDGTVTAGAVAAIGVVVGTPGPK